MIYLVIIFILFDHDTYIDMDIYVCACVVCLFVWVCFIQHQGHFRVGFSLLFVLCAKAFHI